MSNLSKVEKIAKFLKTNQGKKFTTRQIVEHLIEQYAEDYVEKRKAYKDEKTFIQQMIAEYGYSHLKPIHHLIKREKDSELKAYLFWYENEEDIAEKNLPSNDSLREQDLYPIFIQYLKSEWKIDSLRIDEKTSKSSKGKNGNKWLHPDIVSIKVLDQHWDSAVKDCMKQSSGQNVELFSFEIKKAITLSDVREYFFQAVSNSSWANEGYLVATVISKDAIEELRVLSALHGIGVILLDAENPFASRMIYSAKHKPYVDWQSVNRIVEENADFKKYIQYVHSYYKTGYLIKENWNK